MQGVNIVKNPFKEYRRMKNLIEYYKDNMELMMRCKKYAELGLLLFSNVKKGDIVYLIGSQLRYYNELHTCCVDKIEFIGNNDAKIIVRDITSPDFMGETHMVRNSSFGKYFFTEQTEAKIALKKLEE